MPQGWNFPLIDAVAWEEDELNVTVSLPSGDNYYFRRGSNGSFEQQGDWKLAQGKASDELVLSSEKCARVLKYKAGRLVSLKDEENHLQWDYKPEAVTISEVNSGKTALELRTDKVSTTLRKTVLKLGNGVDPIEFESFSPAIALADIPERMMSIKTRGEKLEFFYDGDSNSSKMEVVTNGGKPSVISWEPVTFAIRGVDDINYVTDFSKGGSIPEVASIHPDGKKQILQHGRTINSSMVVTTTLDEGIRREYLVNTPNGNRTRKVEMVNPSTGATSVIYQAFFNKDGDLIKDIKGEYTRILVNGVYQLYQNGKLIRSY